MSPAQRTAPAAVELLESVGSTNAEAFARADAGEAGPLWIRAHRQTEGRGRQGRTWVSEPGNLYASLLLARLPAGLRLDQLPLVAALAIHDAVADVLPPDARPRLRLKWPNDLLFDAAKLAGILVEGRTAGSSRVVIIGVGVNCAHHPEAGLYPATDLAALGHPADPAVLMVRLAEHMAARLDAWQAGNFPALRGAWIARAQGIGGPIRVRLPAETLDGAFRGLDEEGRLILDLAAGSRRTIAAGDVFFPGWVDSGGSRDH